MDEVQLKITQDGSPTLYLPSIDEHYHSINGAIQESLHVYINNGLKECEKEAVNILEIGFGTGLNAYLTLLYSEKYKKTIDYTAIELFPLNDNVVDKLNYSYGKSSSQDSFRRLHTSSWNTKEPISSFFSLSKFKYDLTALDFSFDKTFDIIYFDAFAPDKQPEMWSQDIFDFMYKHTFENGILTTYCAKGHVRRMMQSSGYKVERLPGPPGKREMLRATR